MSKAKLEAAHELIKEKKYAEARAILRTLQTDPTAQRWLAKLDEIAPERRRSYLPFVALGCSAIILIAAVLAVLAILANQRQPQPAAQAALPPTISPASVPTATPSAQGKWGFAVEISRVDDSTNAVLTLIADDPIEAWLSNPIPVLYIRCRRGEFDAYVSVGAQVESSGSDFAFVRIRFDDEEPQSVRVSESTTGDSLFFEDPQTFAAQLHSHERLVFEFTPFNAAPTDTVFDLRGYSEADVPLECDASAFPEMLPVSPRCFHFHPRFPLCFDKLVSTTLERNVIYWRIVIRF